MTLEAIQSGSKCESRSHEACSPRILSVLENLIAPGRRARISPFVEDTQLKVLFGKSPGVDSRNEKIREILKSNASAINGLAQTLVDFSKEGKKFTPARYTSPAYLEMYLAYYFTVNVR